MADGMRGSRATPMATPVKGDDDFTVHCPPGETCFGECAYWEADTALTGLALLTYLGAGYTHVRRAIRGQRVERAGFPAERAEDATAICGAAAELSGCIATRWRRWRSARPMRSRAMHGCGIRRSGRWRSWCAPARPTEWPGAMLPAHRPAIRAFWAGW